MPEQNEKMNQAQQHLTDELAKFAETDADSPEQEEARKGRANAEQEIAEARKSKD